MPRGFNGRGNKLRPTPSDQRWMPEVLFQPQESGPRNRANAKPIEPTPYYQAVDMPVFRSMGPADTEDADSGATPSSPGKATSKKSIVHPQDWDKQRSR